MAAKKTCPQRSLFQYKKKRSKLTVDRFNEIEKIMRRASVQLRRTSSVQFHDLSADVCDENSKQLGSTVSHMEATDLVDEVASIVAELKAGRKLLEEEKDQELVLRMLAKKRSAPSKPPVQPVWRQAGDSLVSFLSRPNPSFKTCHHPAGPCVGAFEKDIKRLHPQHISVLQAEQCINLPRCEFVCVVYA